MEMKYVVPDMAQSFGTLEFAGESEPVFERITMQLELNNPAADDGIKKNLYVSVDVDWCM